MPAHDLVVLYCDAGGTTGLGHLSRCLNLATALCARGVRCTFVLPQRAKALGARVEAAGHGLRLLAPPPPGQAARERLAELVSSHEPGWLVVDHYGLDAADLEALAALDTIGRLAVIDDLGDRSLRAADLVVNPTPDAASWTELGEHTRLLSGGRYPMLAPAFADAAGQFRVRDTVERVVVYLGGALTPSLWTTVEHHLAACLPGVEIVLVASGELGAADRVRQVAGLAPTGVARLFASADLAIGTPSTVAWELCTIGVPALFVSLVDNHARMAAYLSQQLDMHVMPEQLGTGIARLSRLTHHTRAALSDRMVAQCDGRGAERVADAMAR